MLAQKSIYILIPGVTIIGARRALEGVWSPHRFWVLALDLSFALALKITFTIAFKVTFTMALVGLVLPFCVSFRGHSRARGRGRALAAGPGLRFDLGVPWCAPLGDPVLSLLHL